MDTYRILLADDHRMIRQGIRRIIEEIPYLKVVGEAGDGFELLNLAKRLHPDMITMDIAMPNMRGIEATNEIKTFLPAAKVLILTMYKDEDFFFQAISAGADGYLLKEDADIELHTAIEAIRQGRPYISPLLSDKITTNFFSLIRRPAAPAVSNLTIRQSQILKLIAEGKSSREIAAVLHISSRTVENHRTNIMKKLGVKKNIDLVKYALRKGFISV